MSMNIDIYKKRHDELLGYMNKALSFSRPTQLEQALRLLANQRRQNQSDGQQPGANEDLGDITLLAQCHEDALRVIQKKCAEDQFEVVLLGEFAEGKSTTFDVLCNGRELSPQGDQIKSTSAVPVSVEVVRPEAIPECVKSNSDLYHDEWADLHFKDEAQIKEEIYQTFEVYLVDINQAKESIASFTDPATAQEFQSQLTALMGFTQGAGGQDSKMSIFKLQFDLNNKEHIDIVRDLVRIEWEVWNADHGRLSTQHRQQLEVLTLYLAFYGTDDYAKLSEKKIVPVSEFGKYVRFTPEWKINTPTNLDVTLKLNDCIFAFLDFVVIHIQSDFLAQINCRVTDCPGLGASAYDTAVARRVLDRADGVWFVKKCDKQLGAQTLGDIFDLVKGTGRLARTGMSLNLWKPHRMCLEDDPDTGDPCLVNYCKSQLEKEGYEFLVSPINARLAFLSALGKRKLNNHEFTASERKWLAGIDRDYLDPNWGDEKLWVEAVKCANETSKIREIRDGVTKLDEKSVDLLWAHSYMDDALCVMEKIVLEQKARSILIDKGSKAAFAIIKKYEHELGMTQRATEQDAKSQKAALDKARETLQTFLDEVNGIKSRHFKLLWPVDLHEGLAKDLVEYILGGDFCDQFAQKCASTIYKLNNSAFWGWSRDKFKTRFLQEIHGPLLDLVRARYKDFTIHQWNSGSNCKVVKQFFNLVKAFGDEVKDRVKKLEGQDEIFKELPAPRTYPFDLQGGSTEAIESKLESIVESMRRGFFAGLLDALIWILTLPIPDIILDLFSGEDDEEKKRKKIEKVKQDIHPRIEGVLTDVTAINKLKQGLKPMFEQAIQATKDDFDKSLDEMKKAFEQRCEVQLAASSGADDLKKNIADECKKIREEEVGPLRKSLEEFERKVEQELNGEELA